MQRGVSTTGAVAAFAAGAAILLVVALAGLIRGAETIPLVTRDLAAIAEVHPANGALSSLGAFLWFGCATVLIFSATLALANHNKADFRFLVCSAALTLYLWLDDFFMVHETVPWYFATEPDVRRYVSLSILASAGIFTLFYLYCFRHVSLSMKTSHLALALGCLGMSFAWDQLFDLGGVSFGDWGYLIEDGFKWMGIVAWALFFTDASLRMSVREQRAVASDGSVFDVPRPEKRMDLIVSKQAFDNKVAEKTDA